MRLLHLYRRQSDHRRGPAGRARGDRPHRCACLAERLTTDRRFEMRPRLNPADRTCRDRRAIGLGTGPGSGGRPDPPAHARLAQAGTGTQILRGNAARWSPAAASRETPAVRQSAVQRAPAAGLLPTAASASPQHRQRMPLPVAGAAVCHRSVEPPIATALPRRSGSPQSRTDCVPAPEQNGQCRHERARDF